MCNSMNGYERLAPNEDESCAGANRSIVACEGHLHLISSDDMLVWPKRKFDMHMASNDLSFK